MDSQDSVLYAVFKGPLPSQPPALTWSLRAASPWLSPGWKAAEPQAPSPALPSLGTVILSPSQRETHTEPPSLVPQ